MKELKWGETPWDDLTKKELLREVQKMYSAINSANSCLKLLSSNGMNSSFWKTEGTGGHALNKCTEIINNLHENYSAEDIYYAFFRYVDDIFFEFKSDGWVVCNKCNKMVGSTRTKEKTIDNDGKKCTDVIPGKKCEGVLEKLTWKHMEKIND